MHLFEAGDAAPLLVGEHHPEAVAVGVAEGELRAGVRALTTADRPRALGPGRELHIELGHPCALARATLTVERREPGVLRHGQARRAHAFGQLEPHRLGDETRNAPGGVGRAAPPAGMQDLACACGHGEQGVVAPYVGVAEAAPPGFLQAVGFADGGIQVDGEGLSARSGAGAPRAGEQMPGDGVELQGVAPGKGPQEGAHGGGARTSQPSTASAEPARSMFTSSLESPRQARRR